MKRVLILSSLVVVLASSSPFAEEAAPAAQGDAYPLAKCPISGEKLGSDPVVLVHEGREIRFCCKRCVAKFKADPAATLAKIDAAIIAAEKADYPLDTCAISGEKLGSGGMKAADVVVGNRLVRLCCPGCRKGLMKDPKAAIAKIDAAVIAKQKASYPLKTCVVSGKPLGEKAIDFVHANHLIRLCCPGCVKKVKMDPAAALREIEKARKREADGGDR